MSDPLILAIDQGGQSSRVAVYNLRGEQLVGFSSPCETRHLTVDGDVRIEQNPQQILQGVTHCLAQVQSALGEKLHSIKVAGFAGQGSSLLCWNNKTGKALSPVLSWQDIRGQAYLSSITLTHSEAQALTGLRVSPHYGASKIRWCLDHLDDVKTALACGELSIGPIVSYVLWHLTGCNAVDPGHAQRTLLWNLSSNQWDGSLLSAFGIPKVVLPIVKYHNEDFGCLALGDASIPFRVCARDQGASLFAAEKPCEDDCYVNIGTGAFIQRPSQHLVAPDGLLVSPLWLPVPAEPTSSTTTQLYCWEATVNGAASAIPYIQQVSGLAVTPEDIHAALQLEPMSPIYFLNAIGGLGAPYWRTDLMASFSPNLSPLETVLVWLESVIFHIAVNIELMNQLGRARRIIISGGFSNADELCQKLADITGISVYRCENADATLRGIAMMAGSQIGTCKPTSSFQIFHPAPNSALHERYAVWLEAMTNWLDA